MSLETFSSRISDKEKALELFNAYDHFIFDCDGVIWLDDTLIPGVSEFLENLRKNGKSYIFVSNNSSRSRNSYVEKLEALGIPAVTKDLIYPTCYAAALVLKETLKLPQHSKVWVLGDEGIEQELRECGYIPLGGSDPRLDVDYYPEHELLEVDPDVKAVVVGSTKKLTYLRISTTLQYLLHDNKSLPFIGTNIDKTYPGPKGKTMPAGGAMVFLMQHISDRDFISVGKPSMVFLNNILESTGFAREKTIMVGDTLYTDIKFGNDGKLGGGNGSLLVLTGGTKESDLKKPAEDSSLVPTFYIESLGHLQSLLSDDRQA
ncbi:putative 4-nitrophenylphosphatase [Clavispora lusitaniae]|uniref:4-nitrophenylphosphatase n=2 Tax=Clavispora lusitaniae TaxID=36911 RepID=C4Y0P7_CLAL4|nr:uncharacterized protein CLUG_01779 [Clavispora lusitaniae ATCC 42720]QFZ26649.1 putative 4-nitrophenylphosphatase [Clavispora lusitaniae]EEQ37656.1 hypothetical protein CLUG_01779 [Clavispora lusitaniae ATCC 42720]QFZ32317.1 putative 4-nitrophenylphosphatase [Clavispora lusitaniae]QFZ37986.1 putative 4-nitrophenylphosphatase [Clavispora lusitaniae]QFZ43669.1 putative 4-nitrophenylphosphatase [Clavispora lusitaniae]